MEIPDISAYSQREYVLGMVRWIDSTLERRIWSVGELRHKLMTRSPEQIIQDGHICFATPCFDLTSVTAETLRLAGFEVTVVLCRMKRLFQPVGLQSGIEVELDHTPHIVGFGRTSKRLQAGRYEVVGPRKEVLRERVVGASSARRTHLQLFGIGSYYDLPRILKGYDPDLHLKRFEKMQTRGQLKRARQKTIARAKQARPGHVPSKGRWQAL
jgi:hypothetical protein